MCTVSNDGTQVDIGASSAGGSGSGNSDPAAGTSDAGAAPEDPYAACSWVAGSCRRSYAVSEIPDPTLEDLASFRPAPPTLLSEPAGIGVVGMPTNLVAAASEQTIPGSVLGHDARVRFTPISYRFAYGDGHSRTAATGGAPWDALGQAQFSPTATGHAYAERGTYTASVTVQYAAAVSFGASWRDVPGYVEATIDGHRIRVVEARTALVDRTCLEGPAGPGC